MIRKLVKTAVNSLWVSIVVSASALALFVYTGASGNSSAALDALAIALFFTSSVNTASLLYRGTK